MTFRIRLSEEENEEVHISGDREIVQQLRDKIKSEAWIKYYNEYITVAFGNHRSEDAHFVLGRYNLKKILGNKFIADIILDVIASNESTIDDRLRYIIQYWAFEAMMIKDGKSYRSFFNKSSCDLTAVIIINKILDRCKRLGFVPAKSLLFYFLEGSASNEEVAYCSPILPYECEIEKFSRMEVDSIIDIRKNAKSLAIANYDQLCLFSRLPAEVNAKIASHTADGRVLSEAESMRAAVDCYLETKTINAWRS